MASISFPTFSDYPLISSYSFQEVGNEVSAMNMDAGTIRNRRRGINTPTLFQLEYIFDQSDLSTFETWYKDTSSHGSLRFNIDLKDSAGIRTFDVRMTNKPTIRSLSNSQYKVGFSVESLPRTISRAISKDIGIFVLDYEGNSYRAARSNDLTAWSLSILAGSVIDVTPSIFGTLALSEERYIVYFDGINFGAALFGLYFATTENANSITYFKKTKEVFVACDNGIVAKSSDLINWSTANVFEGNNVSLVCAGDDHIIISRENASESKISTDGINWSLNSGLIITLDNIVYADGFFIGYGDYNTNIYSLGGEYGWSSWAFLSDDLLGIDITSCVYGDKIFCLGDNHGNIYISYDNGVTWTKTYQILDAGDTGRTILDIGYSNGNFFAGANLNELWVSYDVGISWEKVSSYTETGYIGIVEKGSKRQV